MGQGFGRVWILGDYGLERVTSGKCWRIFHHPKANIGAQSPYARLRERGFMWLPLSTSTPSKPTNPACSPEAALAARQKLLVVAPY